MTDSSQSCVIWEKMNDTQKWEPYDVNICKMLENAHSKGLTVACLGDVDPTMSGITVNLRNLTHSKEGCEKTYLIRRSLFPANCPPAKGIFWQWQGDKSGDWKNYDMLTMSLLEDSLQQGLKVVNLPQANGTKMYKIDLENMLQINNSTQFQRHVRRIINASYPVVKMPPQASTSTESGASSSGSDAASGAPKKVVPPMPFYIPMEEKYPVPGIEIPKAYNNKSSKRRSIGFSQVLKKFTKKVQTTVSDDEDCLICLTTLSTSSPYENKDGILSLSRCSHMFHLACLDALYKAGNKDGSLQCPTCKTTHGENFGTQPPGSMTFHCLPYSLQGHEDAETVQIIYDFKPGVQSAEHPNPGQQYFTSGFPRYCFLPASEKGLAVLRLLVKAWKRRLIFRIGTSSTTGRTNTVIWNDIHHKTEAHGNHSGHGYPDPQYLDNVTMELAMLGIVESLE